MTDILVTGAAGFVGSHLAPWLAQRDPERRVHGIIRPGPPPRSLPAGVHYVPWDLAAERPLTPHTAWDEQQVGDVGERRLPGHVDAVLHLAQANVPFPEQAAELLAVNIASTQRLLDYARTVGAAMFLLASSGSVYGGGARPWREDDAPQPDDYYGATKLAAELLVRSYRAYFNPIILRLFAPYGPGQTGRLVPGLIGRVRDGRPVILNRGSRPRFNPIYIADLLTIIDGALALEDAQVINVGGDEVLSVRDMAETIGTVLGRAPIYEPAAGEPAGDVVGDVERMHALLRAAPLTPFATGVAKMV